jgi:hypothetical protein
LRWTVNRIPSASPIFIVILFLPSGETCDHSAPQTGKMNPIVKAQAMMHRCFQDIDRIGEAFL